MLYVCDASPAHCAAVPEIVPGVAGAAGLTVIVPVAFAEPQPPVNGIL